MRTTQENIDEEEGGRRYVRRVSVYMEDVDDADRRFIAGMLRGLTCAFEGYKPLRGITNERFDSENPVVLSFTSVGNAADFVERVKTYFSETVLDDMKVRRRYRSK